MRWRKGDEKNEPRRKTPGHRYLTDNDLLNKTREMKMPSNERQIKSQIKVGSRRRTLSAGVPVLLDEFVLREFRI